MNEKLRGIHLASGLTSKFDATLKHDVGLANSMTESLQEEGGDKHKRSMIIFKTMLGFLRKL